MATSKPINRIIAIMDTYDTEWLKGEQETVRIANCINSSIRGTRETLKYLGFQKNPRSIRPYRPETWTPPDEWPEKALLQKRLKFEDVDLCHVPTAYCTQALKQLTERANTQFTIQRYRKELEEVVRQTEQNSVSVIELAAALKESPNANKIYLLNRVEGLTRYLNRNK